MSRPASGKPPDPPEPPDAPLAPEAETWAKMPPEARAAFLEEVLAFHADPAEAMSEGRRHRRAKGRALDELSLHFEKTGRRVYLADEMAVLYPGQPSFQPDILAVLDVEQPEDDDRMAWVVADEGRGLDLVLEVLHHGSRDKDLRRNVTRYAGLGIREYFVYDRLQLRIHGFRLPGPAAREYRELGPRLGRLESQVLGLDLAVVDERLRFFAGHAELISSDELIGRLSHMMDGVEARAAELGARLLAAEIRAEEEAERARGLRAALRESILLLLGARGLPIPDATRERIQATDDGDRLAAWLRRAAEVSDASDLTLP